MTNDLALAAQNWLTYALILAVQLLLVLALRKPVRARFGAVACYRLWLLPLLWLPFYVLGPMLFASLAALFPERAHEVVAAPAMEFIAIELLPFTVPPADVSELSAGGSLAFRKWTLLALIWACGTLALVVWHGYRWLNFSRRLDAQAAPLSQTERRGAGEAIDLFARVPVVHVPGINSAALFGVFKPVLLLPNDFSSRYDSSQRHIMLAHEAVHLRRNDNAWNLLAMLLIALFWINPLMLIAWRYFRLDQELSCDALALERCNKEQQGRYARTLLDSLASAPLTTQPALSAWNNLGDIKERSLMIKQHLQVAARPFATMFSLFSLAVVGASVTIATAGLISPAQAAEATQTEQPAAQQGIQQVQPTAPQGEQPAQQSEAQPAEQPQQSAQTEDPAAEREAEARSRRAQLEYERAQREAAQAQRDSEDAQREADRAVAEARKAAREAQQAAVSAERTALEIERAAREAERAARDAQRAAREAEEVAEEAEQAAQRAQRESELHSPSRRVGVQRVNDNDSDQSIDQQTGRILTEAIEFLNNEQFAEARERLADLRVDRLSPFERSRLHQLLYNLEMNDEDYPGAREQIRLAIESGGLNEQETSRMRYQMAQLYVQEKNYEEGAKALEAWIEDESEPNGAAHYLAAACYYYLGEFDKALPHAEKAVEIAGEAESQEAWLQMLASLYIQQRQYDEAEALMADIVARFPEKESYQQQLRNLQELNTLQ